MRGLVPVLALLVPFAGGSEAERAPVPRGEIFVVGVDGRGRQNLTRTAATESELALSPDGRRIAYRRSEHQRFQIWVMNVDGSDQRRLTSGGDWEFGPQWSPDGRRLAYQVWDYSGCTPTSGSGCAVPDVWTVDADGSGQRKVLDNAFQPRWSPDGSKLLFQRYEANPDFATLGVKGPLRRGRRPGGRSSTESGWAPASTFSASTAAEHDSSPSARRRRGRTTAAGSPSHAAAASGSSPRASAGHAESQPRRCGTEFRFRPGRPPESGSRTTPATSCTSPA